MKRTLATVAWVLLTASLGLSVPLMINYQGNVQVSGIPFDAVGQFRFAIVDEPGTTYYWANDDNVPPISIPATSIPISVTDGLFNVVLGSDGGMASIPAEVFESDELYLRVWFDGGAGLELLQPDQRIAAVAFAIKAAVADDADTLDGLDSSDLEESAEIDADIATHAAVADAHHAKTTTFVELTDTATDAQIPDDITVDYAATAGDAETIDGRSYSSDWPTTLTNVRSACDWDFHNIGGTDDDGEWTDIGYAIAAKNASSVVVTDTQNLGIGVTPPNAKCHIYGNATDPALRVQSGGVTKLLVDTNGGLVVGSATQTAHENGLYVSGDTTLNGHLTDRVVHVGSGGTEDHVGWDGDLYVQDDLEVDGDIYLDSDGGSIRNDHGRQVLETWWQSTFGDYTALNSGYDWNSAGEPISVVAGANGMFVTKGSPTNVPYDETLLHVNPSGDLEVSNDLVVDGAFKGDIGPNNGASFPRPAYDSGWWSPPKGVISVVTHNVGGNVDNYVVDLQYWNDGTPGGINNDDYGDLCHYEDLNTSTVEIYMVNSNMIESCRIRIWYYR